MVADGVTVNSIAAHFGVQTNSVKQAKQRLGIREYPLISDEELVLHIGTPGEVVHAGSEQTLAAFRDGVDDFLGDDFLGDGGGGGGGSGGGGSGSGGGGRLNLRDAVVDGAEVNESVLGNVFVHHLAVEVLPAAEVEVPRRSGTSCDSRKQRLEKGFSSLDRFKG